MTSYTLTYFPGRGGGEICRLTLAAAGIDFTDERIAGEDWQKRKAGMPMKALPVLTIKTDDTELTYCQSGAIARHIAREHGLYGSTKEEGFLIEEVYDSVTDTLREVFKFMFEKDETKKAELQKVFTDTHLPKFADYFNLRCKGKGKDGYIIGCKLSLADIAVFNMVDAFILRGHDDFLKGHESLLNHHKFIKENSKIAGWLEKRPQSQF